MTGSEIVYDSEWCRLRRDMVRLPTGGDHEYHVFEVPNSVVVVPVLADGSIVMLWQYRYPHGTTHWELPAGRIHVDEEPAVGGTRELLEETGYAPTSMEPRGGFFPTNGISNHYGHIFIARGCEKVAEPRLDATEILRARIMPSDEVKRRLHAGLFQDGFTALALFYYFSL